MKKKRLLIILSIFVFIAILIILSSEVFALSTVEVNYLSTTHNITATQEEIIETANIPMRKNVFMLSKQKYIDNIEKSNPYIKVVNIETVFPNKLRIHIAERNEVFVIKNEGTYYYCDEELKILKTSNVFANTNENAIPLKVDMVEIPANQEENVFLNVPNQSQKLIQNVYKSLKQWNESLVYLRANVEEIIINDYALLNVTLKMRTGATIKIYEANELCEEKFNMGFSVYGLSVENMQSGTIVVMKVKDGDNGYKIKAFR